MAVKLFNILFLTIREDEYDFLRYRHTIDSTVYADFAPEVEVTHIKLCERSFHPEEKDDNEVFFKSGHGFFNVPWNMLRFVRNNKPDVVMVHGFVFPFQLLFLRLFISRRCKIIIQHHAERPFKNVIKRWLQILAYTNADAYLFSSKWLARQYRNAGVIRDKHQVHEVMEGSSLFKKKYREVARSLLNMNDGPVFLWVGRLDANKDPLTVLKAFKQYQENGGQFQLYMIYGTNELEAEARKFTESCALSVQVHFVGAVPHQELENWFSAADYFVAASYYEGSGIALCEAMACGCIPVVSNIASFEKMTNHGSCGVLFEPGNADDLYEKLLILSESDTDTMSHAVLEQFHNELSFDAIGHKIKQIVLGL